MKQELITTAKPWMLSEERSNMIPALKQLAHWFTATDIFFIQSFCFCFLIDSWLGLSATIRNSYWGNTGCVERDGERGRRRSGQIRFVETGPSFSTTKLQMKLSINECVHIKSREWWQTSPAQRQAKGF